MIRFRGNTHVTDAKNTTRLASLRVRERGEFCRAGPKMPVRAGLPQDGRLLTQVRGVERRQPSEAAVDLGAVELATTARLHDLDPERYVTEVIRALPYRPRDHDLELAPKYL